MRKERGVGGWEEEKRGELLLTMRESSKVVRAD